MAAADVASMVGVALSAGLPGTLRRRPVLSGGDSADTRMTVIGRAGISVLAELLMVVVVFPLFLHERGC